MRIDQLRRAIGAKEEPYTRGIVDRLHMAGWLACHFPDSREMYGDPGMPDIVAVRSSDLIFVETKGFRGRLSAEQEDWIRRIHQTTRVGGFVWRQGETPDHEIGRVIRYGL